MESVTVEEVLMMKVEGKDLHIIQEQIIGGVKVQGLFIVPFQSEDDAAAIGARMAQEIIQAGETGLRQLIEVEIRVMRMKLGEEEEPVVFAGPIGKVFRARKKEDYQ